MLKTISIITGNSNSGSACIRELYAKYASDLIKVRSVFRSETKAKPYRDLYPSMEIVVDVDASRPESLARAFQGAQSALIVQPHDHSTNDFSQDAQLGMAMIQAAADNGVAYVVYVGSASVHMASAMPIIASRFVPCEELLRKLANERRIEFSVLRGGFFMENCLFPSVRASSSFTLPRFTTTMIATNDIGKCGAKLLGDYASISTSTYEHFGKYYEMHGTQAIDCSEMAQTFSRVLGRPIKWNELCQDELDSRLPPALVQVYNALITNETNNSFNTKSDVQKLLGENEKVTTFEDFVRDHIDQFN